MHVVRAESLGFCFGVRRALERLDEIASPSEATIRGELVHNPRVLASLRSRGFPMMAENDSDRLPATRQIVITAHGISRRERRRLIAAGKELVDTTCPLVALVHEAAERFAERGDFVVVLGRPGHVEVRGIVEDLERYAVVSGPEEVRRWNERAIGVVCQSTFPPVQVEPTMAAIRRFHPGSDIELAETVCLPTLRRQKAVVALAQRVEAVVIVGGRGSNNTRALAERVASCGVPAYTVEGPHEIDAHRLAAYRTVGLTAGTSTPDSVIDAVEARLRAIEHRPACHARGLHG